MESAMDVPGIQVDRAIVLLFLDHKQIVGFGQVLTLLVRLAATRSMEDTTVLDDDTPAQHR